MYKVPNITIYRYVQYCPHAQQVYVHHQVDIIPKRDMWGAEKNNAFKWYLCENRLNYLIGGEAVMELHDPYFITALTFRESCLLENFVCACLAHLAPNQVHMTLPFKGVHSVSGKGLSHNLNSLVLQCMRMNKIFRNDNTTRSTILRMVGWVRA